MQRSTIHKEEVIRKELPICICICAYNIITSGIILICLRLFLIALYRDSFQGGGHGKASHGRMTSSVPRRALLTFEPKKAPLHWANALVTSWHLNRDMMTSPRFQYSSTPWTPYSQCTRPYIYICMAIYTYIYINPWTGKSCFSNPALVQAIFEAPKCL